MAYSPAERPTRLVYARVRKDVRPRSICVRQVDPAYSSDRIRRLEAADPKFMSNRKGWRKFYIWQCRYNRRLGLGLRLGCMGPPVKNG